jgi:bacteriocin biosynthesis cyclodehydratase domain-containing protein
LERHGCLSDPGEEARRERRRRAGRVALHGGVATERALLRAAGVRVVGPGQAAEAALVAVPGEVDRDLLDPLVRDGTPHLLVRLVDGSAVVGPFVLPGRTACLRCVDGHARVHDPDHAPVTERYVRATSRARRDGAPDVADRVLAAVAAAWAVRDVVALLEGRRPASWSRTLLFPQDPAPPREQVWPRHPECGCSWTLGAPASGTMGA